MDFDKMSKMERMQAMQAVLENQADEGSARYEALTKRFAGEWLVTSLESWLQVVERVGTVPYVGAMRIGEVDVREAFGVLDGDEAARKSYEERLARWGRELEWRTGYVLRHDLCMGGPVKTALAQGLVQGHPAPEQWEEWRRPEYAGDLRLMSMGEMHAKGVTAVWARPWRQVDSLRGWPVELRVWVKQGRVTAVSNYYPQRPMTEAEWDAAPVVQAIEHTRALAKEVPAGMHSAPTGDVRWEDDETYVECTFTADYLVVAGEAVWLEGGPGTWPSWGAYPCCLPAQVTMRAADGKVEEAWARRDGAPELPAGQRTAAVAEAA